MVLFSCDLPVEWFNRSAEICIERVTSGNLSRKDHERILEVWHPSTVDRQLIDRFDAGSELWLAKVNGGLAGFGWTIQGRSIKPHFFPLQSGDVHLFDFFVFPEYRGRGINVALVMEILTKLGAENVKRALIECASWNDAQLRSLNKTAFRRFGMATKVTILGHSIVIWH